jgi:hypothetical protein
MCVKISDMSTRFGLSGVGCGKNRAVKQREDGVP